MFEILCGQINKFPKAKKYCDDLLIEGYKLTDIKISSSTRTRDNNSIELWMENKQGIRIHIINFVGQTKLFVTNWYEDQNDNQEFLKISSKQILQKEFKKKALGGYSEDEVNTFLDVIMDDYKYMEQVLIPEYKKIKNTRNKKDIESNS